MHWTTWNGPHLVEPSEPWDSVYAHKPCFVVKDLVVYHYFNAVGNRGRCIALATSLKPTHQETGRASPLKAICFS